ncbi:MAG: 16S rRNA (uracil(1498)-N(3))-methyltransferase [Candidatus Omnitrophota bacterium]
MSRFYVPPELVSKDRISLRGREAHHAKDVMRLKAKDEIVVFDGTGKEYEGIIDEIGRDEIVIKIKVIIEKKTGNFRLALAQAIPKLNKMDLIVEKATELGIERLIPIITERTIAQTEVSRALLKSERWKKLSVVAAKQCGRTSLPAINDIMKFKDSLSIVKDYELAVIACLHKEAKRLREALENKVVKSAIVFIGPEGDFTEDEILMARSSGVVPVLLGEEILRSDTAAVSLLAVLNYAWRW